MKKKMVKRAAATMMTGAMVMSMSGVAFAEPVEKVNLNKVVTTDGNTYAPAETFEFEIKTGDEQVLEGADEGKSVVVYEGVAGGLTLDAGNNFNFTPGANATVSPSYTKTGVINVNASSFTKPGVYHYVVKEKNTGYEGVTYDGNEIDVYVTVVNGDTGLEVSYVKCTSNGEEKKDSLTFTNKYGDGTTEGKIFDLTVNKEVTGNQGDKSKLFDFQVSVDGDENEVYNVVIERQNGETATEKVFSDAEEPITISLKHGESFTIYGLSASDKYSVNEENYEADGYTTTYSLEQHTDATLTAAGSTLTVTNDKNVTTPTGIVTTFAPYVLMLGAAGAAGGMFLRKKKEDF